MHVFRTLMALVVLIVLGRQFMVQAAAPRARPRLDQYGDSLPLHATARLGTTRLRHPGGSAELAFSRDGKLLASSGSGVIRLWRVADGRLTLLAGRGEMRGLTRSGEKLFTVRTTKDGVFWYDVAAERNAGRLSGSLSCNVLFSPDRKRGAESVSNDLSLDLLDLSTGKTTGAIKGDGMSLTAAFSRDGEVLLTGDRTKKSGRIRFWNVATKALLRDLPAGRGTAYSLALSDDGKTLAIGHATMNFFDDADEKETAVTLRDAFTAKELHVLSQHGPRTGPLAFSPDSKMVAVGTGFPAGAINLYDVKTGKALHQPPGHRTRVSRISFRPSGREIVTVGDDWVIRVWDNAGKSQAVTDLVARCPLAVAIDSSGTQAAWLNQKGQLFIRDLKTGQDKGLPGIREPERPVLAFSPNGKALAVWSHSPGGSGVRVVDLTRAKTLQVTVSRDKNRSWAAISAIAISADGKRFAMSNYDRNITLHDTATGRKILSFEKPGEPTGILVFSRDGRTLAASHDNQTISLWDVTTGKRRPVRVSHPSNIPNLSGSNPIALSPDGTLLASGGGRREMTVRLWDVATGKERARLAGHTGGINTLAFSPDGKRLVSGSDDSTALVWDVTEALVGSEFVAPIPVRGSRRGE